VRAKGMIGTLNQQASEIDVAGFCDAELRISIAGRLRRGRTPRGCYEICIQLDSLRGVVCC
jgi:hypothetical protein